MIGLIQKYNRILHPSSTKTSFHGVEIVYSACDYGKPFALNLDYVLYVIAHNERTEV